MEHSAILSVAVLHRFNCNLTKITNMCRTCNVSLRLYMYTFQWRNKKRKMVYNNHFYLRHKIAKKMEMPGIEPGAFHMQSERSTTEPHPLHVYGIVTFCLKK